VRQRTPVGLRIVLSLFLIWWSSLSGVSAQSLEGRLQALDARSFSEKEVAIGQLVALRDGQVLPALRAMLDGKLYVQKSSKRIVIAEDAEGRNYAIRDALSEEDLGLASRREVSKIRINNTLRTVLRGAIAELGLFSPRPEARQAAALEMLKQPSAETLEMLERVQRREQDPDVRATLALGWAASALEFGTPEQQLEAASILGSTLEREAYVLLQQHRDQASGALQVAIDDALERIELKRWFSGLVELGFFGLSLGAVLLLTAVGLAITFGVMGVINMAHGEMIMLGAYTTFVIQQLFPDWIDGSLLLAVPAAFLVSGGVGILIERTVIRALYGRPLETLLATFGISLVLQQAVRSIFGPLNQSVLTPSWMQGTWKLNGVLEFTFNRMAIILLVPLLLAGLMLLLKRSSFGLQMRAVAQNRSMAASMGIRTDWVDALTFGLGSGIAGVAGVAISQLTNVGPNLGQSYIIDSFMVVVFGGVGNLWGTLVGALTLGVVNKLLEPLSGAVMAKILVLVFIILFIQKRPRGLFALKGRFVEA
jgi:urea transport system permease protein